MSHVKQVSITLQNRPKGFHLITEDVVAAITKALGAFPETGLLHLFIQHTSAALAINENSDATVRQDLNDSFDRLAPESEHYRHNDEGLDDMPAHVKSVLCGSSVSAPISGGKLALGTWQGLYLCEFRNHGGNRKLIATIVGA